MLAAQGDGRSATGIDRVDPASERDPSEGALRMAREQTAVNAGFVVDGGADLCPCAVARYFRTIRCARTWTGNDSAIGPVIQSVISRPTTSSLAAAGVPSDFRSSVSVPMRKYASFS